MYLFIEKKIPKIKITSNKISSIKYILPTRGTKSFQFISKIPNLFKKEKRDYYDDLSINATISIRSKFLELISY